MAIPGLVWSFSPATQDGSYQPSTVETGLTGADPHNVVALFSIIDQFRDNPPTQWGGGPGFDASAVTWLGAEQATIPHGGGYSDAIGHMQYPLFSDARATGDNVWPGPYGGIQHAQIGFGADASVPLKAQTWAGENQPYDRLVVYIGWFTTRTVPGAVAFPSPIANDQSPGGDQITYLAPDPNPQPGVTLYSGMIVGAEEVAAGAYSTLYSTPSVDHVTGLPNGFTGYLASAVVVGRLEIADATGDLGVLKVLGDDGVWHEVGCSCGGGGSAGVTPVSYTAPQREAISPFDWVRVESSQADYVAGAPDAQYESLAGWTDPNSIAIRGVGGANTSPNLPSPWGDDSSYLEVTFNLDEPLGPDGAIIVNTSWYNLGYGNASIGYAKCSWSGETQTNPGPDISFDAPGLAAGQYTVYLGACYLSSPSTSLNTFVRVSAVVSAVGGADPGGVGALKIKDENDAWWTGCCVDGGGGGKPLQLRMPNGSWRTLVCMTP